MRLLRTAGSDDSDWVPRLCTRRDDQPYAILSHCWLSEPNNEVLFSDIEEIDRAVVRRMSSRVVRNARYIGQNPQAKPGFPKLQNAARQALKDGFKYIWVDTCCIDKSSSAELSEAINSMWKWYKSSSLCYAHLADMPDNRIDHENWKFYFSSCRWWRRGWTLQELLAPTKLVFFSSGWHLIGHKVQLDLMISDITWIDPNVINGTLPMNSISVAQRMSWASVRTTSRPEDIAYCLMGLFSVNMPLLYGEGEKAFMRLQQEIMKDSEDQSIFAWKDKSIPEHANRGLLATSPAAFLYSRKVMHYGDNEGYQPYSMTNKGLSITYNLLKVEPKIYKAILWCADADEWISLYLKKVSEERQQYARVRCGEWGSVDLNDNYKPKQIFIKQIDDQGSEDKLNDVDSFRLFRISRTYQSRDIRLSLFEADMLTSKYTAVTHVASPASTMHTVQINGEEISIPKSDFDFLQEAYLRHDNELWWLESICLSQKQGSKCLTPAKVLENAHKQVTWDGKKIQRRLKIPV